MPIRSISIDKICPKCGGYLRCRKTTIVIQNRRLEDQYRGCLVRRRYLVCESCHHFSKTTQLIDENPAR